MFLPVATIMVVVLRFSLEVDAELLGSPNDAAKICWSNKEISVDKTRIPLIVYYLKSCADTLSLLHSPCKRELSAILSQKIHDAIPAINKAYYEGNVDYSFVHDLHKLHGSNQCLRTQDSMSLGKVRRKRSWIKIRNPRSARKRVMPLIIRANQTEKEEACNTLIVSPSSGRRIRKKVPLPYLDNVEKPKRIAVPFVSKPLYDLTDSDARSLLVKYYITGVKCLSLSSEHNQDILVFNRNFYIWLLKCVLPRIEQDSQLYPAFGGVFKILETIHDKGLIDLEREIESDIGNEICVQPSLLHRTEKLAHSEATSKRSGKVAIASSSFCIIITLVLTTFLFLTWLLIVFLFLFCRCCRYHRMKRDSETDANNSCSKEQLLQDELTIEDNSRIGAKICKNEPKPLTNEIRPVSTEFQPLITSTPDRDLKRCAERGVTKCPFQNRCQRITPLSPIPSEERDKEKPKNTGFSKFLAPIKREKEESLVLTDQRNDNKECKLVSVITNTDENPSHSSRNDETFPCSNDMPKWQCSKRKSKWQCSQEKKLPGGGISETTIKVFPKDVKLDHGSTMQTGSCPFKRKKQGAEATKEPCKVQPDRAKKGTSNSSISRKTSTGSVKSDVINVDSNYKCKIKFVGAPPKCEQCSDNLYNDVMNMLSVYKEESTMESATDTSEESVTSETEPENQVTESSKTKSGNNSGKEGKELKMVPDK
nr:PREDICTED: uncharacterized protein LOC109033322 isoform X1 [Bemisia tabaci]